MKSATVYEIKLKRERVKMTLKAKMLPNNLNPYPQNMKDTKSNQRKSVIIWNLLQIDRSSELKSSTQRPFFSEGDDASIFLSEVAALLFP